MIELNIGARQEVLINMTELDTLTNLYNRYGANAKLDEAFNDIPHGRQKSWDYLEFADMELYKEKKYKKRSR